MNTAEAVLAAKKPETLRRYLRRVGEVTIPLNVGIPKDPREAMLLGMTLARKVAYEDGLVDGVALGLGVLGEAIPVD